MLSATIANYCLVCCETVRYDTIGEFNLDSKARPKTKTNKAVPF